MPDAQARGAETLQRALPGPQTTGEGIIPGSGMGGGGGSGGGTGTGTGRGIGPGTQFFGARDHAHSFAYVIDCSGSMNSHNSLTVAKRELLSSLNQLPPDAEFTRDLLQPRGQDAQRHPGPAGHDDGDRRQQGPGAFSALAIIPDGGTDHMAALSMAMALKPEVIFFLTDADLMTNGDVDRILAGHRHDPDPGRRIRPRPAPEREVTLASALQHDRRLVLLHRRQPVPQVGNFRYVMGRIGETGPVRADRTDLIVLGPII